MRNWNWQSPLEDAPLWMRTNARVGGTGSAGTLPMTEEEMAEVQKRPIGFVREDEKPKRRRKPKSSADM